MDKKDDRIRLSMLYRLMKVSRREKGYDDVSDIETVSSISRTYPIVVATPCFKNNVSSSTSRYDTP